MNKKLYIKTNKHKNRFNRTAIALRDQKIHDHAHAYAEYYTPQWISSSLSFKQSFDHKRVNMIFAYFSIWYGVSWRSNTDEFNSILHIY